MDLLTRISIPISGTQPTDLRCCCGRDDCVFLRHNCSVLSSVERDVHAAAKMGQVSPSAYLVVAFLITAAPFFDLPPEECAPPLTFALQTLLARHEAYMASAERDRAELTARIEQLENDNTALETRNKSVTDENQTLRDELDGLNELVSDADTKIDLLEATLRDSQREVRRLENAATRAASLEQQIAVLEHEQMVLQNTLVYTKEEARTAMHRWRHAERGINDLQEQLERMEKEAREERERHVEVLNRMEKQRIMERELHTAAGRLKGAAAVKSMSDGKNGGNVVSHFVRDLLQDNATLQLGMAELREMLMNSNDEMQMLREQLLFHQPVSHEDDSPASTLRAELEQKEPPTPPARTVSQELHIHHHYHVQKAEPKKPKKKRQGLTAGTFTPPHFSAPSSPMHQPGQWHINRPTLGTAFSHTPRDSTSTVSMTPNGRWSLLSENPSEFAPSSAPSSPPSNRRSSLFDRGYADVSFPGSPDSPTTSVDPASPGWKGARAKRMSNNSDRSIAGTAMFPTKLSHPYTSPSLSYAPQPHPLTNHVLGNDDDSQGATSYTTDDLPDLTRSTPSTDDTTLDTVSQDSTANISRPLQYRSPESSYFDSDIEQRPNMLRRVLSHESIISLSNGMDIHTLKARPSQLTMRPLGLTAAGTNLSAINARPTISRGMSGAKRGSVFLRENLAELELQVAKTRNGNRAVSGPPGSNPSSPGQLSGPLKRIASWRPWKGNSNTGAQPSPVSSPTRSPRITTTPAMATLSNPAVSASSDNSANTTPQGSLSSAGTFRAPGINQPGGIPGFHEYFAAHQRRGPPSKLVPDNLEQIQEAMQEVLDDG
ncbi:hypothetical protein B0T22DRAFT_433780 [Podospora appendiculata]|uniref:Uncharacterized protein n=1 Tax=Podospora appendiculata TaxID=314037 RepID=A0AAE1C8M4_9PEZI|nr:hypothetical protein B0T22DRAFT_433780 [Podospora appendiculata]